MFNLLCLVFLWITSSTNLISYYHRTSQKVGIPLFRFRKHEKLLAKVSKSVLDIAFLKRCRSLELFPKFLNFKVPQVYWKVSTGVLKKKALNQHIRFREEQLKKSQDQLKNSLCFFRDSLSFFHFSLFKTLFHKFRSENERKWNRGLNLKFTGLWLQQRHRAPDSLVNKSRHELSVEEQNALRLGSTHCIIPPFVDEFSIKASFERFHRTTASTIQGNQQDFINGLRYVSTAYIYSAANQCKSVSNRFLHKTLKNLKNNKDIRICRFDKGHGTLILDSEEYFAKLDTIVLSDKFQEVEVSSNPARHPVLKTEGSIQYYLRRYIKPVIPHDVYESIYPTGSRPGAVYGLAKVHKPNVPLRPVVSMVGTAQYNLAKYLDSFIKPVIPDQYMLSSTADFVQKSSPSCSLHAIH